MAIITVAKDDVIDYVPASERGSDDPTVVGLKHVTFAMAQQYERLIAQQAKGAAPAQMLERTAEATRHVQRKQFIDNVAYVKNYFVRDREITTGAELYEVADQALIMELIRAMESSAKLTEGQLKNFVPRSGSGSDGPPASS